MKKYWQSFKQGVAHCFFFLGNLTLHKCVFWVNFTQICTYIIQIHKTVTDTHAPYTKQITENNPEIIT